MKATFLEMNPIEQTQVLLTKSIAFQSDVAGSMPRKSFELLSENERKEHILNALEQMPQEVLVELMDNHEDEL
ncbi:hypothetical protein CN918_28020 [Priestia megaterium]|nr:hypothetical protein CN918_28020 [Priestia megaterium]